MIGGKIIADLYIICKAFELDDAQHQKVFDHFMTPKADWQTTITLVRHLRDCNADMKREYGR